MAPVVPHRRSAAKKNRVVMNMADILEKDAWHLSDRTVVVEDGREVRYAELKKESSRVTSAAVLYSGGKAGLGRRGALRPVEPQGGL